MSQLSTSRRALATTRYFVCCARVILLVDLFIHHRTFKLSSPFFPAVRSRPPGSDPAAAAAGRPLTIPIRRPRRDVVSSHL
jgi:hypothetical protein